MDFHGTYANIALLEAISSFEYFKFPADGKKMTSGSEILRGCPTPQLMPLSHSDCTTDTSALFRQHHYRED
jgi:hypothetical protein